MATCLIELSMTFWSVDNLCFPECFSENIASTKEVHWHKIHWFWLLSSLKKMKLHIPCRMLLTGNVSTSSMKGWGMQRICFCLSMVLIISRTVSTSLFSMESIIVFHNGLQTFLASEVGSFGGIRILNLIDCFESTSSFILLPSPWFMILHAC